MTAASYAGLQGQLATLLNITHSIQFICFNASNEEVSHLAGEDGGVVDDAGDVDGAADRDVEPGRAQYERGGLKDSQPDVLADDGSAGDLALVPSTVLHHRGPDGQAPVGGVRGVAGLVPRCTVNSGHIMCRPSRPCLQNEHV